MSNRLRLSKWTAAIAVILVLSLLGGLLSGCASAGSYVKDSYPLVDVQGKGKDSAKVYLAEGKDVPTVAKELAAKDKPKEISKDSTEQMFLVYDDKVINVQKDPQVAANTLIEIDSVSYAKEHYDSSFLQGFVTASILQSLFGGGWFDSHRGSSSSGPATYKGYSSTDSAKTYKIPDTGDKKPTTSDRTGSFSSKGGTKDSTSSGSAGSSKSGSSGSWSTKSGTSSRKNDGSMPSFKSPSKPKTSSRSGSFSRRR